MKKRTFLKNVIAVSALAKVAGSLSISTSLAAEGSGKREFYELRAYRFKVGDETTLLDSYLEKAAVPALNRMGIDRVGVFTEPDAKEGPVIYMLIAYPSLEKFAEVSANFLKDPQLLKDGADYLNTPKAKPAFARVDSWLLQAFSGMPVIELSALSKEKKERIFELRTYESHSELKAIKKIEMFNAGEIQVMRDVGLAPVFYGSTIMGSNMPHLVYMLSAENKEEHKKHFGEFSKHPTWKKISGDPQFADTVSKISSHFLVPTKYSQI
ncbi:MAG: family containing protein [Verrucomicrobiales bacterium]|nr:family containing protein [Verrucomicrobiales bacterium]